MNRFINLTISDNSAQLCVCVWGGAMCVLERERERETRPLPGFLSKVK
jgi:hypothetical protein